MEPVTIEELKEHQETLRQGILQQINGFIVQTGEVPTISIDSIDVTNSGGGAARLFEVRVSTEVL